jgi:hypothetical protein
MSTPALKRYRVVVFEWLSHDAFIEAADASAAEAEARRLWASNAEHELFSFCDSGIDGVVVEEIAS